MKKAISYLLTVIIFFNLPLCKASKTVIANVNGEEIYLDQLERVTNPQIKAKNEKEKKQILLDTLINEKIVLQKAKNEKISYTYNEVEYALKEKVGDNRKAFLEYLSLNKIELEDALNEIKNKITYQKFKEQKKKQLTSSNTEFKKHYLKNIGEIKKKYPNISQQEIIVIAKKDFEKKCFSLYLKSLRDNSKVIIYNDYLKASSN